MIKEIITGRLGRQKSPTIAPGTDCPIPEDKTFTNMSLFNASVTGGLVPVPELGLEAKVVMSKEIVDGHYFYQLVISETIINLKMQACMTWGIPFSEMSKLESLKKSSKTKSKR